MDVWCFPERKCRDEDDQSGCAKVLTLKELLVVRVQDMGHEGMSSKVYTACIRSCSLYWCETCAMKAELESKVYTACIRSYSLYGCETWAMRAELSQRFTLHVLEDRQR